MPATDRSSAGPAVPRRRRGPASAGGDDAQARERREREAAVSVGAQLRDRRLEFGLSLRQFARDLGVSPSFVSQIETGKSQPSVATLYTICSALGLSVDELFGRTAAPESKPVGAPGAGSAESAAAVPGGGSGVGSFHGALDRLSKLPTDQETPVVTPAQRRRLVLDSGVTWEQLSAVHGAAVDFLFVRYDVGGSSVPGEKLTRHEGVEYGYVISGTLEVTLGFECYQVRAGESVSFDSSTPHRLTNAGDVPVEAIWFVLGRDPRRSTA